MALMAERTDKFRKSAFKNTDVGSRLPQLSVLTFYTFDVTILYNISIRAHVPKQKNAFEKVSDIRTRLLWKRAASI